ncbi:MAG: glycosyltransferase [Cyanobacteria bacterium P01_A01_bin.123]
MHIFILTLGSRGDVQPYVALGKGLKNASHQVTLCTSARFESFITAHGLNYGYMNDEMMALMDSAQGRDLMENTTNLWEIIKATRKMSQQVAPMQHRMLQDSWKAAEAANPDLIIFHPKAYGGPHFAEKLGIPVIMAVPLPMLVPTAEHPNVGFPALPLGGWYNKLTYQLVNTLMTFSAGKPVKAWRQAHHLPRQARFDILHTQTGKQIPVLHCYSRHVAPEPNDWPDGVVAIGYWSLNQQDTWQPSSELQDFLAAGSPPVYVGFGSMAGRNPERLTQIVIDALQQADVRGIIATGWGGLTIDALPENIFKIDQASHDWLFPKMAAVVHHGGAGTTAAGLRAGRPTVICPFFGDQPFWGQRVHALGVGSKPIPQKKLTVETLATAIREVTTNPNIRQKAEVLGETLRQEEGIERAIGFIESVGKT